MKTAFWLIPLGVILHSSYYLLNIATHAAPEYNLRYNSPRSACDVAVTKECVVLIDALNPFDEKVTADYGDISGPGFIDFMPTPRVHLVDIDGKSCVSSLLYINFAPREHKTLRVVCKYGSKPLRSPIANIIIDGTSYNVA